MTTLSPEYIRHCTETIADELGDVPGGLLPILHRLQDTLGYVPAESVPVLAKRLNLSRADIHGVISFYHDFRNQPAGKHTLYVCRSEACQAVGGSAIAQQAKEILNRDWHETSGDGHITLEPVYCLGNCACAPAVMLDDRVVGRVTRNVLESLIREVTDAAPDTPD